MNSFYIQSQESNQLYNNHNIFVEKALNRRRFTHSDIVPLIEKLKSNNLFNVSIIGESVEKRSIYQVKIGTGSTKVLLWSQMHGDEATATMAIFDIFNFFSKTDSFENIKKEILSNCTLYFVPMLNPDGAERFTRRNALNIDLNRDALRLQSPEAVLLKKLQNDLKPEFGFNLHDQSPRYSAGKSGNLATISFLATAYNEAREINPVRKRSMQLIVGMNRMLQKYIPNQVGRFSDEFEPRAFGDNIQKWGTTLILIESGGFKNDPEKQYIRKLNYVSILSSLSAIANKSYEKENIDYYNEIPENGKSIFDLLIRNAKVKIAGKTVIMDVGINKEEVAMNSAKKYAVKSTIEELGDLSTFFGTEEIDASGLELISEAPLKLNEKANFIIKDSNKTRYKIKNGSIVN